MSKIEHNLSIAVRTLVTTFVFICFVYIGSVMRFLYDIVGDSVTRNRIKCCFLAHGFTFTYKVYTKNTTKHAKVKNQLKPMVYPAQTKRLLDRLSKLREQNPRRYNGSYKLILRLYKSFPDFNEV